MANKEVEIEAYQFHFRPQAAPVWGFPGGLSAQQCYGYIFLQSAAPVNYFVLAIVDDGVGALPDSTTQVSGSTWAAAAAIELENLPALLDVLRNEKPIYMGMSDTSPDRNAIQTVAEPVGEGEMSLP